jgi:hypothetical protein
MIVFDLQCRAGRHRFEGWFSSSEDFASQQERGLVNCPECGSLDVGKAVMAPNVGRKGNQGGGRNLPALPETGSQAETVSNGPPMPPEAIRMMKKLAKLQAEALKESTWVGEKFAEDARAMHYGEREMENIHGQATLEEARELYEEGIAVSPLPFPVAPPGKAN